MIKFSIIMAYVLIAILFVIVFFQWKAIEKLTPAAPANNNTGSSSNSTQRSASNDGSAPLSDMLEAIKESSGNLEIKATFNK